ncbi:MAG TPA: hypothetical protein VK171_12895, partial [Fimbriimonas sp.]|nr:hypothetical protein [Fimbriimonas sp.]
MKSAPFLTLLATVLSSIALPQSRPWSSWSDATNGTEFSWCIVQTKDPISTWKIRNNNSEPISGILLVQYSTPSGALEWSGRFESIVPFIGPGKSSGGWSSYTVPSTKIHQIKWLSLHIGKRIVI